MATYFLLDAIFFPINFHFFASTEILNLIYSRKPCSGYKLKEITGSDIFAVGGENGTLESDGANPTPTNKTGLRMYQVSVVS